jgi:hypothetical protein
MEYHDNKAKRMTIKMILFFKINGNRNVAIIMEVPAVTAWPSCRTNPSLKEINKKTEYKQNKNILEALVIFV